MNRPTTSYPGAGWEYQQDSCDVHEISQLCNHMAGYGWEFVAMVTDIPDVALPVRIGDNNGPLRDWSLKPHVLLFRRPIIAEAEDA